MLVLYIAIISIISSIDCFQIATKSFIYLKHLWHI